MDGAADLLGRSEPPSVRVSGRSNQRGRPKRLEIPPRARLRGRSPFSLQSLLMDTPLQSLAGGDELPDSRRQCLHKTQEHIYQAKPCVQHESQYQYIQRRDEKLQLYRPLPYLGIVQGALHP